MRAGLRCSVRQGGADWLGLFQAEGKTSPRVSRIAAGKFFFARPFCLSHSCIQLMPLHWRVEFYNLRIFAGQQYLNQHDVLSLRSNGYITSSSYQKSWLDLELFSQLKEVNLQKKFSNTAPFYVFIQLIVYGVFFGEKETDRHKLSRLLLMDPLYKQTARHHLGWVSVFFGDFFPWLPTFLCWPGLCLPSMPK